MKQLTCEMCGGAELVKQDGMFVCQSCGVKYSVEDARKMMIEGTVEVAGTVKVDSSDRLKNLYQIARRAKDDNNGENAAKYYDMILVEDPASWEATFYIVYFKATECKIAQIQSAAVSVNNCIDTVLKLIKDTVSEKSEQEKAVTEVSNRIMNISSMLYNGAKNHYNGIDLQIKSNYIQEYVNNAFSSFNTMYNLGDQLESIFEDEKFASELAITAWKEGIAWHKNVTSLLDNKESNKNVMTLYADKVKKYDASYQTPDVATGGCYVATKVYGSYDCPQVWALRRYRDYTLAETWYGRAFIYAYYATSPTIVKYFGHAKWFEKICKFKLDSMITKLQSEGVECTPYQDRNW